MVDISVIIPTYNRVSSIERSIDSVLSQNFVGTYEIIVSDDGSTDGTIELIKSKYNKSVLLLEKPVLCKEQGAAGARNRGLQVARGRYVCFLDSDDTYENSFFTRCYDAFNADSEFGYIYCRVNKSVRTASGEVIVEPWTRSHLSYIDKRYHVLHRPYCICTIGIMCRRDILSQIEHFDTTLTNGEDSDMWIRMSEISRGRFLDFVGATYYISGYVDNQLTKSLSEEQKRECGMKVYNNALTRYYSSANRDSIRLLIIRMGIMSLTSSIKNTMLRKLSILCHMLVMYPLSMVRYMILRLLW